jgi:hypothetical protein
MTIATRIAGENRFEERTRLHSSRHWLLLHAGETHSLTWRDGERLLSLCTAVRVGRSAPQGFTFLPLGAPSPNATMTVFVNRDDPLELLTDYEHADGPKQSHWFG